ncbi:hypothetical protein OBBRIDRAFT_347563 [Obba rivulosa]|uniref:Uncharacterized protein n=1 Tax=Obba rivulosa TaxID=1052685 RepID=A0A8E2DJR1_9APHY|nr:hypothetical protein OBBRIDRAFT_347563 [Obba rivulosa]
MSAASLLEGLRAYGTLTQRNFSEQTVTAMGWTRTGSVLALAPRRKQGATIGTRARIWYAGERLWAASKGGDDREATAGSCEGKVSAGGGEGDSPGCAGSGRAPAGSQQRRGRWVALSIAAEAMAGLAVVCAAGGVAGSGSAGGRGDAQGLETAVMAGDEVPEGDGQSDTDDCCVGQRLPDENRMMRSPARRLAPRREAREGHSEDGSQASLASRTVAYAHRLQGNGIWPGCWRVEISGLMELARNGSREAGAGIRRGTDICERTKRCGRVRFPFLVPVVHGCRLSPAAHPPPPALLLPSARPLAVTRITPGISRPLPASPSPPIPLQETTPHPVSSTTIQLLARLSFARDW